MLIAQVVFVLEREHARRHAYKVRDATDHNIHASANAGVTDEYNELIIKT